MVLPPAELWRIVDRCDALLLAIEGLDETQKKVYSKKAEEVPRSLCLHSFPKSSERTWFPRS